MSGYLADWNEAERRRQEIMARFPGCTGKKNCPAEKHPLDCGRRRRELHPELYARLEEVPDG